MAAAAPSPRRLPRAERERQILDVAHARFARDGYANVTMDGVAAEVGVTKPLLYAYWGNKERIYLACLEQDAERLLETVAEAVGSAPNPADATEVGLRSFFDFVSREHGAFRVLFDETLPTGGEIAQRVHEHRERIVSLVAATLLAELPPRAREKTRVEVEALSTAVLGAAEALARWWLRTSEPAGRAQTDRRSGEHTPIPLIPAADAAELLIATVVPGLRARTASHEPGDPK